MAARLRSSVVGFARAEPLVLVLVLVSTVAYAAYGILRHLHLDSQLDLGIFDQAVWHYSHFGTPQTTLAGSDRLDMEPGFPSILGDHLHPLVALLAPLYWIWSDPRMLIIAQAALVAASFIPVFLYARLRLGRLPAYLIVTSYALFWGVHSAVAADFHEVAFAPVLMASAVYLAERERWRGCLACLGLLLLVKEDLAIFVATFGIYLALRRRPRQGAAVFAAALAWYFIATGVLIPHFAGGHGFRHWTYTDFGRNLPDAVANLIRHPGLPFFELLDPIKVKSILYLLVPFLALVLYSPIAILAAPLIAERMFSTNSGFWGTDLHYSLAIAPILALGAADGLRNLTGFLGRGRDLRTLTAAIAVVILVGNLALARRFPVWLGLTSGPGFYKTDPVLGELDRIPDDASVAAQSILVPHLAERDGIWLIRPDMPVTDYIVYEPGRGDAFPNVTNQLLDAVVAKRERLYGYRQVFRGGGVRILARS